MPWYRIIHFFIMALATLAGVIHFQKLSTSSRWILTLLAVTILNEFVAYYITSIMNSNFITSYFFIPVQYGLISTIFLKELPRLAMLIQISLIILISTTLIIIWQNRYDLITIYPSSLRTLSNLFIILLCLTWLRALLNYDQTNPFIDFPVFWVSIGLLLFSIITMFNFSAFNFINNRGRSFMFFFQYVRIGANYILYSLLLVALLSKQRTLA